MKNTAKRAPSKATNRSSGSPFVVAGVRMAVAARRAKALASREADAATPGSDATSLLASLPRPLKPPGRP